MMTRRRFLQITTGMAAVAAIPAFIAGREYASELLPAYSNVWIPTVPQVIEWLEYYKICVRQAHLKFADLVLSLGQEQAVNVPPMDAREFEAQLFAAEKDFNALEDTRRAVGWQQGAGYTAGLDGHPRRNPAFLQPSHPAFGWYNYWAVGDYDRRRRLGLPRQGGTLEEEYGILSAPPPMALSI